MTEYKDGAKDFEKALTARYGEIVRARGAYLYTRKGVRLIDLWLDAGRAVLGRGCSGSHAFRIFKNTLERGQTGSFSSPYKNRFEKAVLSLIPEYNYAAWFSCEASLQRAAESFAVQNGADISKKPLKIKLWRPWLSETPGIFGFLHPGTSFSAPGCREHICPAEAETVQNMRAFYPPFALQEAGIIGVFKTADTQLPPSDSCSGALLNALTRAVYDLIREIPAKNEKDWEKFDSILTPYFERIGPYLIPKIPRERYADFAHHCLECALLLPPYGTPAIVPCGAHEGDFSRLKRTAFTY